ncbi:hypothetical protein COZ40_02420 [Candidatus Roizmanbacteria bacterium CG_4_10_14_3_um_filter_39_13]|uniref:TNase-like domain-containing protein n=4 Tax=Candidatus Roizmaniibacteriota TaxID=1752723 RepID=A0A2H0KKP4_9BACT|nr:MAG: hypothetical protein COV87_01220 [Candidatus Roizmanbacteria bacterium CG11_big_fil_rev_8_21_14_0_20_37_16]PIV08738.1 MAG: hypothetical protein COS52_01145 [Candidatus Roizmanbacteria bacterium CG03_land_8_20_14_0_80_39_12]PIV70790.1 MAG: hypothetical protein COW57_03320 [Candidatus Roizmanbacteria bacterium CG17_big_fil_post_rev_8_21_14_2_50_39_7]PIX68600.1 MAG: hypothetical protein COZ40_02420 [Candidatus Roizmanbacteria bacterium CG_4_10_14_3_um_filter_39_13]
MHKKWFYLYIFFIALLFVAGVYILKTSKTELKLPPFVVPSITPISTQPVSSQSAELAIVKRVVDGDTIELSDGRKVRYIGIDTPELHHPTKGVQCFGKEAMEKNKELVEGKTIKMKKDISETDRYKRLLRYIWVGDIFVNEYLAREGYALQATFPPDVAHAELFRLAAEDARIKNKGLWNKCK